MYRSRVNVFALIPVFLAGLLIGLTVLALDMAFWSGGWVLGACRSFRGRRID